MKNYMLLTQPCTIKETKDFAVVFKPAKMHCVLLGQQTARQKDGATLQEWFAAQNPAQNAEPVHRLDFETHGLVLFAKNPKSFKFFKALQDKGEFIKEYSAVCAVDSLASSVPGFPLPPAFAFEKPLIIESYFRPYGPGRKLVRPVVDEGKKHKETAKDKGGFYRTEITNINGNVFTLRLRRGFRHQIRCHLCWIGCPILNDPLYPQPAQENAANGLALRAHGLFFTDPASGKKKECRIALLA